jgi:hypothetical protein
MRRQTISSLALLVAGLLSVGIASSHDDVIGTRFVAPAGETRAIVTTTTTPAARCPTR